MTFATVLRLAILLILGTGCAAATVTRRPIEGSTTADPLADASVVSGKLPNGFSYYVLRNDHPAKALSLRLVVKAGAVQEDADQPGAAHFVEHLAFAGTQNFKKSDIHDFILGLGLSPGADVNGKTGLDSTAYRLIVPTDFPGAAGKAIALLRDIAGNMSFDPAEIERERRVLLEEWRLSFDADQRVERARWEALLGGSRYADRVSPDTPADLKRTTRDALRRFYRDWYRPNTMALIAVGPTDPKALVRDIERIFGDFRGPARERPATLPDVPNHKELVAKVITDPELTRTSVVFSSRFENDLGGKRQLRQALVQALVASMMEARLYYARTPDASFLKTQTTFQALTRRVRVGSLAADIGDGKIEPSVRGLLAEFASASRYGFSEQELSEARQRTAGSLDEALGTEALLLSETLADSLQVLFLSRTPCCNQTQLRSWAQELLPNIALTEVNAWARDHGATSGGVLFVAAPMGVVVPAEAELRAWAREVALDPPRMPLASKSTRILLGAGPKPGKVTHTDQHTDLGLTIWQLSNGARVIVKPLKLHAGAVRIQAWLPGGTASYSDADFAQARFASDIARGSGAGPHDARELYQVLGATGSSVAFDLLQFWGSLNLDTNSRSLETALHVAYLRLVESRPFGEVFAGWKARTLENVRHRSASPGAQFWDAVNELTQVGDPRATSLSAADVERVDPARAYSIWLDRLSTFDGATFFIVGDVDLQRLKPVVASYFASLPSRQKVATSRAEPLKYPTDKVERIVVAGHQPRSAVLLQFMAPDRFHVDLATDLEIFEDALTMRLREILRDQLGDVYALRVRAWWAREPDVNHALQIVFECAPDKVDRLTKAVFDELRALGASGISNDHLEAVRLRIYGRYAGRRRDVNWWLEKLKAMYVYGDEVSQTNDANEARARVTSSNVSATARRLLDEKRYVRVVLRPEGLDEAGR